MASVEPVGENAAEPDPLAEILAQQKEAAASQNPAGIGAAGANVNRAAGQGGFQPVQQGGLQPGPQGGYQPGQQGGFQPGPQGGFQPGSQGGFQPVQQGGYRQVRQGGPNAVQNNMNSQQYTYTPTPFDSKIPEIAIGKYVIWSVFDILFSLIFGILGLIFVLKINKSSTVEEQQKNLKMARIFLIIGTVASALNLVIIFIGGMS